MSDDLQFEKVEYAGGGPVCAACGQALGSPWWQSGTARVCERCKRGIDGQLGQPLGMLDYLKAGAAGLGMVLVCAAGWAAIEHFTGYQLGIVALAVGWAMASVMRRVAGQGSRLLQVMGVAFVYLTVSCAAVPTLAVSEGGGVVAWIIAVPVAFALPFLMWSQGVTALLWYLIVFFGLSRAWSGLAAARVAFQGPFK